MGGFKHGLLGSLFVQKCRVSKYITYAYRHMYKVFYIYISFKFKYDVKFAFIFIILNIVPMYLRFLQKIIHSFNSSWLERFEEIVFCKKNSHFQINKNIILRKDIEFWRRLLFSIVEEGKISINFGKPLFTTR